MSSTFHAENCVTFLDPRVESRDIDFATFAMEIVLNHRRALDVASGDVPG
jgi:hypothetical protein